MKKQFTQRFLYFLLLFIQVGLMIAVFVVNDLTGKKAGVYRHVYTRRMQYMEGVYNSTSIQWQSLLVASFCILLFILLLFYKDKDGGVLQSSNCLSHPTKLFRHYGNEQRVFYYNDGIPLYHYGF